MTPEEYRDMLYAQIEASVKRQIKAPPETLERFTHHVESLVIEKCAEHGNPENVYVEVQYDINAKTADIIVTELCPVVQYSASIVWD